MDPLSIVVAVAGLADVATRTSTKAYSLIDTWRHAPAELSRVRDDTVLATDFLQSLKGLTKELCHDQTVVTKLNRVLSEHLLSAHSTLSELEKILDYVGSPKNAQNDVSCAEKSAQPTDEVRRDRWLRKKSKIISLQKELNGIKFLITEKLISINVMVTTTTYSTIQNLKTEMSGQLLSQAESIQGLKSYAADMIGSVEQRVSSRLSAQLESPQQTMAKSISDWQEMHALRDLSNLERAIGHGATPYPYLKNLGSSVQSLRNEGASTWRGPEMSMFGHNYQYVYPGAASRLSNSLAGLYNGTRHAAKTSIWRLQSFKAATGTVTLSYSVTTSRGQSKGKKFTVDWAQLQYTLPSWLWDLTLSVLYKRHAHGNPELLLRVSRHIPKIEGNEVSIFGCIQQHDVQAAKILFATKKGSVFDTYGARGDSAIITAMTYRDVEMTKLLIAEGASLLAPEISSKPDLFPRIHYYWSFLHDQVGYQVPLSTFFEDVELSMLHEVVIGIKPVSLKWALSNSCSKVPINTKDNRGCTPLHYAASMNKAEEVNTLIRYGADIDARTKMWTSTPLYEACLTGSTAAAKCLLDAGADVSALNLTGIPPLRIACDYGTAELVTMLLDHGAEVASMKYNKTKCILDAVVYKDNRPVLDVLLSRVGMDVVNDVDSNGDTVICKAIQWDAPQCLASLLAVGGDYHTVDHQGCTVLHKLAILGTARVVRVFSHWIQTDLHYSLDAELENNKGKTPLDLFRERITVAKDLDDAFFEMLVQQKMRAEASSPEFDSASEEDDFYDAQSNQVSDDEADLREGFSKLN